MSAERSGLVVALDGPARAGKSTLARLVARDLDYTYIDSGAMYRAVGLLARRTGIALDDASALHRLVESLSFDFPWIDGELHTVVNGEDVSVAIRTRDASMDASLVSKVPEVRAALVALQRLMGERGGIVMEGRDIGTVVFPMAELKVFLTASARERGTRRLGQMRERGQDGDLEEIIEEIKRRDLQDSTRAHSPLKPASDSVVIDSSQLGIERVRSIILRLVHARETGAELEQLELPIAD